jgi:carbonic anhydrase
MMKGQVGRWVVGATVSALIATAIGAGGGSPGVTADDALRKLMAGNARFVDARLLPRAPTIKKTREELVRGQKPFAIILSCSDSRVPPEIVFDETLGQLFVVRVAGNVVDPVVLGSIEYAVEHLGPALIMVLGHEACGAVTAAFDADGKAEGNVEAIIELIEPAVQKAKDAAKGKSRAEQVEAAIDRNIDLAAGNLTAQSPLIKDYVDRGKLKIVKGKYHLRTGEVTMLQ